MTYNYCHKYVPNKKIYFSRRGAGPRRKKINEKDAIPLLSMSTIVKFLCTALKLLVAIKECSSLRLRVSARELLFNTDMRHAIPYQQSDLFFLAIAISA